MISRMSGAIGAFAAILGICVPAPTAANRPAKRSFVSLFAEDRGWCGSPDGSQKPSRHPHGSS
jgi:hypothetical protein